MEDSEMEFGIWNVLKWNAGWFTQQIRRHSWFLYWALTTSMVGPNRKKGFLDADERRFSGFIGLSIVLGKVNKLPTFPIA